MAFDFKKLIRTSADIVEGAPKHYDYVSSDAVTSAGYFPADCGLKATDIVTKVDITVTSGVVTSEVLTPYYISEDSGVLTASAIS